MVMAGKRDTAFWPSCIGETSIMSNTAPLANGSSETTKIYLRGKPEGQVIHTDPYRWQGTPPKPVPNAVSVKDLIKEFSGNAEFRRGLKEGRQWIAETAYPEPSSLKAIRLNRGLSQKELAELAGTTQPYIARVEAGNVSPYLDTVRRLAEALDFDFGELCSILVER